MIRVVAFLAGWMLLGLILAFAAVRAQPDDADVRAFLLPPDGCAMPCWQGIQPGVTTAEQATTILQAHPWVKRVVKSTETPFTYIYWEWSAQRPAFVIDPSALTPPVMWVQNGIVQLIIIHTSIPYAEVRSLLGAPSAGDFNVSGYLNPVTLGNRPNTLHSAAYFDGRVVIDTRVFCPINLDLFWNAPIKLTYSNVRLAQTFITDAYDLTRWFYRSSCLS